MAKRKYLGKGSLVRVVGARREYEHSFIGKKGQVQESYKNDRRVILEDSARIYGQWFNVDHLEPQLTKEQILEEYEIE